MSSVPGGISLTLSGPHFFLRCRNAHFCPIDGMATRNAKEAHTAPDVCSARLGPCAVKEKGHSFAHSRVSHVDDKAHFRKSERSKGESFYWQWCLHLVSQGCSSVDFFLTSLESLAVQGGL